MSAINLGDIEPGESVVVEIKFGLAGRIGLRVGGWIMHAGAVLCRWAMRDIKKEVVR